MSMPATFAVASIGRTVVRRGPGSVRLLAWAAWIGLAAMVLASAAVWASEGFPSLPLDFGSGPSNVVAVGLIALTAGTVGALLAWRHPRNPIGWLLLAEGLTVGFLTPVNLLVAQCLDTFGSWPAITIAAAWLVSALLTPTAAAVGILVLFLFPDGRFAGRRWRVGAVATLAGSVVLAVASAGDPAGLVWYPALPNPTSVAPGQGGIIAGLRLVGVALTVVALVAAVASIAARYRRTERRERLQLRWVVGGAAVMCATFVPFLAGRYVFDTTDTPSDALLILMAVGAAGFPLTVAIAMIHEHLYEIDALIWRTLVYIPLMGLLAGLYAASVAFFQRLFISVTGNSSDGAIVISALMLAAVFSPAKSAIESRVSRRLKPPESHAHDRAQAGEPMPAQRRPEAGPTMAPTMSALHRPAGERLDSFEAPPGPPPADDHVAALEARVAALERALEMSAG
jgi:hypothetical protein